MTKVTEEMKVRAMLAYSKAGGPLDARVALLDALDAALNPPAESEIAVSEAMKKAGGLAVNAKYWTRHDPSWCNEAAVDAFRAMERERRKAEAPAPKPGYVYSNGKIYREHIRHGEQAHDHLHRRRDDP